MSSPVIVVSGLGKRYRLGARRGQATSLRESLTAAATGAWRRVGNFLAGRPPGAGAEEFWALRDVSFEVQRGEVVGIIGRNGAGKSTLLKILSRITEPTEGRAVLRGRVGSLLEVGTGFHPELTGRENVYLSGAILGMRKAEIDRKFDEIVAFADIEKFLDTPCKHYSSGMYVRLGFAVAAHLEPEILIVDEVLAVGDAAFQKKCLGKMGEVSKSGRTVLFVSHNMPAVLRLCTRALLLSEGRVVLGGEPAKVVDAYYCSNQEKTSEDAELRDVPGQPAVLTDWRIIGAQEDLAHSCFSGEGCVIRLGLVLRQPMSFVYFGIALWAEDGSLIWAMRSIDDGRAPLPAEAGPHCIEFGLPWLPLRPGNYQLQVSAFDQKLGALDIWYPTRKLRVVPRNETGIPSQWQGILSVRGSFRLARLDELKTGGDPK